MDPIQINMIYPASRASEDTPNQSILELKNHGFKVQFKKPPARGLWDFYSASIENRLRDLVDALVDPDCGIILAGRGGYGTSDLLPLLPWDSLRDVAPKLIVGFSDICALQSACHTLLNWPAIHGPMPDTPYWKNSQQEDVSILMEILKGQGDTFQVPLGTHYGEPCEDLCPLFGGCLSVLTNLIGTPYLPSSLAGYSLYFEDIGEHPGKLLRYFNQWLQSGLLAGVRQIILGDFNATRPNGFNMDDLCREIHERAKIPVAWSPAFGHCTPNLPIGMGCEGQIKAKQLTWKRGRFGFES